MNSDRKVLHVITVLSVGGVETWLVALLRHINALRAAGKQPEQFHILMTGARRADLDDLVAELGATLHYIPFSRRTLPGFTRAYRRLLRKERFAAIHDHQDYSAGWHFLAGAGLLPRVRIAHVHNPVARLEAEKRTALRRSALNLSARAVKRFATHILGTSERILGEYGITRAAFPRQDVRALHCGFDVTTFRASHRESNESVCREVGWPPGSRIALFVGRLDGFNPSKPGWNHKNPRFALDVARAALERDPSLHFVMVGGGETARRDLAGVVAQWDVKDRIRLVGAQLDVQRYMAAAECLIFPSLEEGLGMVAVEAQAAGLRVLASDTVPTEAVVVPELVSFLPLSQNIEAWRDKLLELASLPRYDLDSANAAVRASPFSVESSYDALHAIYGSGS